MSDAPPKHALVTGGSAGIGRRTVEQLVEEGWRVWVLDRDDYQVSGDPSPNVRFVHCDLRVIDDVVSAVQTVAREAGALHAVVCSAGVVKVGELEHVSIEDVDLMLDVNLKAPWLVIREAIPSLRKAATEDDPARVVVLGSIAGVRPKIAGGVYAATKAALHVLAQVYAVELGPSSITVNAVAPGSTNTGMAAKASGAGAAVGFKTSGVSPLGRIAEPADIADAIAFLLSPQARYISGVVLPVDGGTRAAFNNR